MEELTTIMGYLKSPALIVALVVIWWLFRLLSKLSDKLQENTETLKELASLNRILIQKSLKD